MNKRGMTLNKKGQLTIIVIVAAIIIALAILVAIFWPKISGLFMSKDQASRFLASQVEPLRQSITDCVEKSSTIAFTTIGLQGGYYDTTGLEKLEYIGNKYTVVMYKDAAKQRINKLPSLPQIEQQYQIFLEKEGNSKIDKCLGNLANFKRKIDIETGARKINALIYYDAVILEIDWPMKISKSTAYGKVEQNINQKPAVLLIPLGYMWQTANTIVDCETRANCKYEGLVWDQDTWNNPFRLQYINKEAISLNKDQILFLLESIPYRPSEQAYKFNFAIDRS